MLPFAGFIAAAFIGWPQSAHGGVGGSRALSEEAADSDSEILASSFVARDPIAGSPVSFRLLDKPLDLTKRSCVGNGTNYCFGNDVNFCGACGTCCSSSSTKFCCAANAVCCGNACCASGQTCSNGQCLLPVVTVTATSTVTSTATSVGSTVTVVNEVIETSIVTATVDVTTSSWGATQTDLTLVTVTAPAKRTLPTQLPSRENHPGANGGSVPLEPVKRGLRNLKLGWVRLTGRSGAGQQDAEPAEEAALDARQATVQAATPGSALTTTVTAFVTQLVTNSAAVTVTTPSTVVVMTTVSQTRVIVLDAQATAYATSTVTWTPPKAFTEFITLTTGGSANPTGALIWSSAAQAASSASQLSTTTIAGVAVGATVFALLAAAILILYCRLRRRRKDALAEMEQDSYSSTGHHYNPAMRPRVASLPPRFIPSPTHHGDHFQPQPPTSPTSMASYSLKRPPHHQRSSSGFTTLVGQATPPSKAEWLYNVTPAPTARTSHGSGSVPSSPGLTEEFGPVGPRAASPLEAHPEDGGLRPDHGQREQDHREDAADDRRSILSDDTVMMAGHSRISYQNVGGQWVAHQPTYRIGPGG